ncbi:MAG: hypothetical protein Q8K63_14240, partial [Acidimicrobiales bacterium]|nr:hypothetical protein [Acidimicrobiales bacterium]
MAAKKAKPPKLPDSAPQDLKDFVACARLDLQLDPARTDWLPRPPGVPDAVAPSVTVTPSSTPGATNAVDVAVGWGFVSIHLPVSVVEGTLRIDTADLPDLGGLKSNIDNWTTSINNWMRANGKELSGLDLRNGKVHLTKRATTTQPPATGAATTPGQSSAPLRRARAAGTAAVLALATGAVAYVVWPDDDDRRAAPLTEFAPPTPDVD